MVNFPSHISDCDSHSPALLDFFLSSDASICFTMAFPSMENSDYVVVSVSIDFPSDSRRDTSAAASEFCEWVQAGIDAYIPHRVKTHSGPCFLATCTDVIVHRNPFFRLYQKNKSSESKVKFRWAINRFKSVLQAAKFVYTNKTKRFCNSQDG